MCRLRQFWVSEGVRSITELLYTRRVSFGLIHIRLHTGSNHAVRELYYIGQ